MDLRNYLTIDVEDFFQVSAFEPIVPKDSWASYPSRVETNTRKILAILEAKGVKATFFILGWTAERHPLLVKRLAEQGHEIGCHSYLHRLVYDLTPDEFYEDTKKAKDILEQITGSPVNGYRAPSYSITKKSLWALEILRDLGFTYDSSVFPIHHDRYGLPGAPRFPFTWDLSNGIPSIITSETEKEIVSTTAPLLDEFPISTSLFLRRKIPVSGGGYFRLFPYWFTRMALEKINLQERKSFIFYLHPWEFDPEQPRMTTASALSRFRHYNNLNKTSSRFIRLLDDFSFGPMNAQPAATVAA